VRVGLTGAVDGLPWEIHVLDEDAPFWRVVVPYGLERTAIFHATVGPDSRLPEDDDELARAFAEAAARLGLGEFSPEGAKVERLPEWEPVWTARAHATLRRVLLEWRQRGIVGVGRGGAFAALDDGEEIRLARAYRDEDDPDQREAQRVYFEPPTHLRDLDARITRFVER
jgi:hypothetical protein